MGIFSAIKKQFIDVIEWTEDGSGTLVHKYQMADNEIQTGGKLTVRETQMALFLNEGVIADQFGPGLYTLNTQNLPVLTTLKNWDKAFNSPFKSDVYFFSTREQTDQKWGTPQPITIRDKELGAIRIRAFGSYSYKIKNPSVFFKKISGTVNDYTVADFEGQIRGALLTAMATYLSSSGVPFLDMASNQQKFSDTLKTALAPAFAQYGLEATTFYVQSISLPEELQAYFDKAAQMRMVGDINQYAKFQAADSIKDAANNPGGIAGMGVGMGAGVALGQSMAAAFTGGAQESAEDPIQTIEKLHELVKKGILSEAEFNDKKSELLKKIK